jgi:hypothetical protein
MVISFLWVREASLNNLVGSDLHRADLKWWSSSLDAASVPEQIMNASCSDGQRHVTWIFKFLSPVWRVQGSLFSIWSSLQKCMCWRWLFYRKRKKRSILIPHSILDMAPDPLMAFAHLNCPPLSMCSRQWECLVNTPWESFSAFTRCFQVPYPSLTWGSGKTTGHWDLENNANLFKNFIAAGVENNMRIKSWKK